MERLSRSYSSMSTVTCAVRFSYALYRLCLLKTSPPLAALDFFLSQRLYRSRACSIVCVSSRFFGSMPRISMISSRRAFLPSYAFFFCSRSKSSGASFRFFSSMASRWLALRASLSFKRSSKSLRCAGLRGLSAAAASAASSRPAWPPVGSKVVAAPTAVGGASSDPPAVPPAVSPLCPVEMSRVRPSSPPSESSTPSISPKDVTFAEELSLDLGFHGVGALSSDRHSHSHGPGAMDARLGLSVGVSGLSSAAGASHSMASSGGSSNGTTDALGHHAPRRTRIFRPRGPSGLYVKCVGVEVGHSISTLSPWGSDARSTVPTPSMSTPLCRSVTFVPGSSGTRSSSSNARDASCRARYLVSRLAP
mmetsp:Transcript_10285/g.46456  ORF Transcript_10285/g.46456 Transcript_10285/m.46456 type:complete len:364 (-) Transcript_10285:236-1327(-)